MILVGAAGVALVTMLLSCSGDDDTAEPVEDVDEAKDETSTTATEATTTTVDPESPEGQAIAVYQAGQDFLDEAVAANPPQPPKDIDKYFVDVALEDQLEVFTGLMGRNEYVEATHTSNPVPDTIAPNEVVLNDCLTVTERIYDAATGQEKNSVDDEVFNWRIRVVSTESGWRVSEITPQEEECSP